ncbi:BGTF surface domain-containing protein [Halorubrum sp. FL23]|uniref:BGTF surface domain-containing protein n=1 Tax=Halorubrum sp. FL23 TaxID=3458704 RepID=UPI004034DBB1
MTNETNYRKKTSAVLFAAIMVVSMFAAGFAAAPAAALTVGNNGLSASTGSDIPVDSTGTQDVTFNIDVESGDTDVPVTLDVSDTSDFSSFSVNSVSTSASGVTISSDGTVDSGLHTLTVTKDNGDQEAEDATITITYDYDSNGASAGSAAHDIYVDQTDASGDADGSASYSVTSSAVVGGIAASTTDADPGQQVEVTGVKTQNNDDHVAVWTTDGDGNPETPLGSTQVGAGGSTAVTVGLDEPYTSEQELIAAVHPNDGGSPDQGQIYATASGTVTPTANAIAVTTGASELEPGQTTAATATATYEGTNGETGTADVTSDVTFDSDNTGSITISGNTLYAQNQFGQSNIGLANNFQSVATGDVTETTVSVVSDASGGSSNADVQFLDDDFAYQGQDVLVDLSDTGQSVGSTVRLRQVDSFDNNNIDSSSNVEQLNVERADTYDQFDLSGAGLANDDPVVLVETDDLESADFFIRGSGIAEIRANTFEVGTQSLSAEFDDDSVNDAGSQARTDLDISSNRASYSLNVSADGDLSDEELYGIFAPGHSDSFSDLPVYEYDESQDDNLNQIDGGTGLAGSFGVARYQDSEEDADEKIVLVGFSDEEYEVDFTDIDTGDYDIDFNSTDTEASDAGSITVEEQDTGAGWSEGVYSQSAGDVVEMSVELEDAEDAYVQVGDEDSGYVDILYIEDDDDDDEVTFQVNTRTVGTTGADSYYSDEDIVESMAEDNSGQINDEFSDVTFHDEEVDSGTTFSTLDDYRDALDVEPLVRPLQPTDYPVAVNGNGDFVVNDDDESELDDELDLATIDLVAPELGDITTWTAPSDSADENDNLTEVLDTVSERSEIAEDDRLVIQVEASGLYGAMVQKEGDYEALDNGFEPQTVQEVLDEDGEGINIDVEAQSSTGNQQATSLNFGGSADTGDVFTLVDNDAGEMYIIVDTSSSDAWSGSSGVEAGDDFDVEVEYETDDDNRYEFFNNGFEANGPFNGAADGDSTANDPAYPYFMADSTVTSTGEFSIVEEDAEFDNLNNNDEVEVEVSETAEVSGTTSVAPGSDASVRIRSADGVSPSFVETADAEISEDGSFSAEFDLSGNAANDTGTVNFRVEGSSISNSDMVLIEEVQDEDGEDGSDDGEDGSDDGEDGSDDGEDGSDDGEDGSDGTDDGSDGTDDGSDGEDGSDDGGDGSEDGTPGFGALVALVALIAAALLATRRNE